MSAVTLDNASPDLIKAIIAEDIELVSNALSMSPDVRRRSTRDDYEFPSIPRPFELGLCAINLAVKRGLWAIALKVARYHFINGLSLHYVDSSLKSPLIYTVDVIADKAKMTGFNMLGDLEIALLRELMSNCSTLTMQDLDIVLDEYVDHASELTVNARNIESLAGVYSSKLLGCSIHSAVDFLAGEENIHLARMRYYNHCVSVGISARDFYGADINKHSVAGILPTQYFAIRFDLYLEMLVKHAISPEMPTEIFPDGAGLLVDHIKEQLLREHDLFIQYYLLHAFTSSPDLVRFVQENLATEMAKHISNLSTGESKIVYAGYAEHAVYIQFKAVDVDHPSHCRVTISNFGDLSSDDRFHDSRIGMRSGITIGDGRRTFCSKTIDLQGAELDMYLLGVLSAVNQQSREVARAAIYHPSFMNPDPVYIGASDVIFSADLQRTGNCVAAGYTALIKLMLGESFTNHYEEIFEWLLDKELAAFAASDRLNAYQANRNTRFIQYAPLAEGGYCKELYEAVVLWFAHNNRVRDIEILNVYGRKDPTYNNNELLRKTMADQNFEFAKIFFEFGKVHDLEIFVDELTEASIEFLSEMFEMYPHSLVGKISFMEGNFIQLPLAIYSRLFRSIAGTHITELVFIDVTGTVDILPGTFIDAFASCTQLECLSVNGCDVDDSGLSKLFVAMSNRDLWQPKLRYLDLQGILEMSYDVVLDFCRFISSCPSLRSIIFAVLPTGDLVDYMLDTFAQSSLISIEWNDIDVVMTSEQLSRFDSIIASRSPTASTQVVATASSSSMQSSNVDAVNSNYKMPAAV